MCVGNGGKAVGRVDRLCSIDVDTGKRAQEGEIGVRYGGMYGGVCETWEGGDDAEERCVREAFETVEIYVGEVLTYRGSLNAGGETYDCVAGFGCVARGRRLCVCAAKRE